MIFKEEYISKQHWLLKKLQSHWGITLMPSSNNFVKFKFSSNASRISLYYLPPGTARHEALKPLPFILLSVLNRIASSLSVLKSCMGFADGVLEHN